MFTKADEKFAAFAADASKRQMMISSRQSARTILFWCAALGSVCSFMGQLSDGHSIMGGSIFLWVLVLKFDSDVRLLTVIEKMSGQNSDGQTA
jgi:hypothetical protein